MANFIGESNVVKATLEKGATTTILLGETCIDLGAREVPNKPGISHRSAWTTNGTTEVPEPSAILLFGLGLLCTSYWRRKRKG